MHFSSFVLLQNITHIEQIKKLTCPNIFKMGFEGANEVWWKRFTHSVQNTLRRHKKYNGANMFILILYAKCYAPWKYWHIRKHDTWTKKHGNIFTMSFEGANELEWKQCT